MILEFCLFGEKKQNFDSLRQQVEKNVIHWLMYCFHKRGKSFVPLCTLLMLYGYFVLAQNRSLYIQRTCEKFPFWVQIEKFFNLHTWSRLVDICAFSLKDCETQNFEYLRLTSYKSVNTSWLHKLSKRGNYSKEPLIAQKGVKASAFVQSRWKILPPCLDQAATR